MCRLAAELELWPAKANIIRLCEFDIMSHVTFRISRVLVNSFVCSFFVCANIEAESVMFSGRPSGRPFVVCPSVR